MALTREPKPGEPTSGPSTPRQPKAGSSAPGRPKPRGSRPRRAAVLSPADAARLVALVRMKRLALALLVLMALVFAVSFALQDRIPALQYVRAAAEGGMVGALADWFAVTALFRYPLGLRIPHTNIIASRKDEIGASLGEFVGTNFLSEQVVRGKLGSIGVSRRLGTWLKQPDNARRLTDEIAVAGTGLLTLLSDDAIKDLIETVAREHLVRPEWAPPIGRVGARLLASGQQHAVVDLLLDRAEGWLHEHPEAFGRAVSARLPGWLPGFVDRLVDDRAHREVLGFVASVRADAAHPLREAIDRYLVELADDLEHDPAMINRVETLKLELLDSARLREFASETWEAVKVSLAASLGDPASDLRDGIRATLIEVGERLAGDGALGGRIDRWIADSASYLVRTYRDELAGVITETVERWDAAETSEKIELQVGRDLQYIRINGTVVGSLAGLAIFAIAQAAVTLF
ncbi:MULTISPECIES: DUF445 domain-containing protein [unclassified Cryobacterium]|uniref:DUF445 domain-containing protein n=1 Tax=unclassified Cryobacterium TaxID=2649013 RepID=UPI002AB3AA4E|nr:MULTISPECIES: DUF445 domain-containing protein [unclassified Cryobacterium]MDY7541405.1 DUF445 domain-containing protein [Cryobacterium sp. 5B3]MEB0000407.1 DUF445 domain-containing protein [Cryobacterium sp. RTS3]MEB0266737.1 DUF445 domain-containing protein [Cryobacterium sp. 10I5]MEB0274496.1 DUF445 domain-containing protein [Cryobacterium sp. 5B3]